jgi:hypothetical protein
MTRLVVQVRTGQVPGATVRVFWHRGGKVWPLGVSTRLPERVVWEELARGWAAMADAMGADCEVRHEGAPRRLTVETGHDDG